MTDLTRALAARATSADRRPAGCCELTTPKPGVEPGFFAGDFVPAAVEAARAAADPARIPELVEAALGDVARGRKPWPLYLHGPPGTGKTMAALAVSRRTGGLFLAAGWWAWCRINDQAAAREVVGQLATARLVIVDEIGLREQATEWQVESLKLVLDGRFGRPLIVTGNVQPERLRVVYDERIDDRLAVAGTVCHVGGDSAREWRPAKPR